MIKYISLFRTIIKNVFTFVMQLKNDKNDYRFT